MNGVNGVTSYPYVSNEPHVPRVSHVPILPFTLRV